MIAEITFDYVAIASGIHVHPKPITAAVSPKQSICRARQKVIGVTRGAKRRKAYSISKKLNVITDLEKQREMNGDRAMTLVSKEHKVPLSTVCNWFRDRHRLRAMAEGLARNAPKNFHHGRRLPTWKIFRLRGGGRKVRFPEQERKVFVALESRRVRGVRVGTKWIRMKMVSEVRQMNPPPVFKGSRGWLTGFLRRHQLRIRVKTNGKHLSFEQRLPKIKKWHRDLRSRLRNGPSHDHQSEKDPKWGVWLPSQRYNVDQVFVYDLRCTIYSNEYSLGTSVLG